MRKCSDRRQHCRLRGCRILKGVLALAALTAVTTAQAATIVSDGFNRTGNVNGSSPDVGTGVWSAYSSGYSGGDANGSASYTPPVTPTTDGANANFAATTFHENTEAYLPFTASPSGLLTATAVVASESGTSNSWSFLALSTGASTTPDVYNGGSMVAWMLLKYPTYNSGNYGAQLFIGSGTGTSGGSQVNYTSALSEETITITQDPATGAINAYADGNLIGTGTRRQWPTE